MAHSSGCDSGQDSLVEVLEGGQVNATKEAKLNIDQEQSQKIFAHVGMEFTKEVFLRSSRLLEEKVSSLVEANK